MENMNYGLILSLEDICLRKMAVILCSQRLTLVSDVMRGLDDMFFQNEYEFWEEVQNDVKKDMRKLEIPPLLAEQMTDLVERIYLEEIRWIRLHVHYLKISIENADIPISLLCWTNLGTIDYRKSAEKLIKCEKIDVIRRYKLACLYCLEDYLPVIWENFPEKQKKYFYEEELMLDTERALEFCWPYILNGQEIKLNDMLEKRFGNATTFNQFAFEYSARNAYKVATEYFWGKLTDVERETSLFRSVQEVIRMENDNVFDFDNFFYECRKDIFYYLFPLISTENKMKIIKEYPLSVWEIFFRGPRLDIFLDIAKHIWPFFSAQDYTVALQIVSGSMKYNSNLTKLFQELFLYGSSDFRKCFVDQECIAGLCFLNFFMNQNGEGIRIIFRGIDLDDKLRLVCSKQLLQLFYNSILRENCLMMEVFLQEAALSKESKETLKELFSTFLTIKENKRNVEYRKRNDIKKIMLDRKEILPERCSILTDTEMDTRETNRKANIWEKFIHIVDDVSVGTVSARNLDEEDLV